MIRALGIITLSLVMACTSGASITTDDGSSGTATSSETSSPADSGSGGLTCWTSEPGQGPSEVTFQEMTADVGLVEPLRGMHAHAAIWTDIDGDDRQDLFVGTFADREPERYQHRGAPGPSPDRLLIQSEGFSPQPDFPDMYSRTSGGTSADLDGDGDLDLLLSRNYRDRIAGEATTQVLENDDGGFQALNGTGIPDEIGGRSVAILDYNIDGRADVFITEDRWSGGRSVLLENQGGMRFEDVTSEAGLPGDVHGLGVTASDFNNDGLSDIFVAGSNRLFVAGDGGFVEARSDVFRWNVFGDEDDVAGVSAADLNRDGWLDLAVGHHYNSTIDFGEEVPVRIYLNRGPADDGMPNFEDVTSQTGLPGLPTKAPHVELNDFDNDGWPDLLTSASAADGKEAAVFRHEGLEDDVPQFSSPEGIGSAQYWVASPTADFDRDGRLDVFLVEWEPALPSLLMRNVTGAGNWLQVSVGAQRGFGLGWRVDVYDDDELIAAREISVTQGYSSGVSPIAHFGLADRDAVSIELTPPGDEKTISIGPIAANQHIRYPSGCES